MQKEQKPKPTNVTPHRASEPQGPIFTSFSNYSALFFVAKSLAVIMVGNHMPSMSYTLKNGFF